MSCSPFKEAGIQFALVKRADLAGFMLHPEERMLLSNRVTAKREEEFSLGRLAAKNVLTALGASPPGPVLKGPNHEPLFPSGITGSIGHADGVGIAAAAVKGEIIGIGVDLEAPNQIPSDRTIKRIATSTEMKWIMEDPQQIARRFTLIFSGKEAIYKAYFSAFSKSIKNQQIEFQNVSTQLMPTLASGLIPAQCSLSYSFAEKCGYVISGVTIVKSGNL